MPVQRYSQPQFNPYGDDAPLGEPPTWAAPHHPSAVNAVVDLPGSKSLTNRELILSALATEPSLVRFPMHARDSALMIEALRNLGVTIDEVAGESPFGPDLLVTPPEELIGSTSIDCGLAGNVMRFAPLVAALALGPTTFDGDAYARKRPMSGTIAALRALGVDIAADHHNALPFTVHGTGQVRGGIVEIDASASSQFVSGVLMAAPRFVDGVDLRHVGERLPSMPHIEMTIAALAARGVRVDTPVPGRWVVAPQPIAGRTVVIEPDLSNAGPFLAAAVATAGSVTVRNWPTSTTQVGDDLLRYLPLFGATVERIGSDVRVTGGPEVLPVTLDLHTGGELAPPLVALAALATGTSRFTGIGHIRHHETDRLAALVAEIRGLGGDAIELEDGIEVREGQLHGGLWHAYADHRMATAGAIIGLRVPGVEVDDIGATSKTLPQFRELWNGLLE
ncbi:MAG TPA: 3-phosphoshikimate 1-carboxyvinyltransferase [Microbacteriaceae bacterium]|nr:3-phosphoshikimate 1-carboxyvinyltransferase [Microbacteriaceae bacterium]